MNVFRSISITFFDNEQVFHSAVQRTRDLESKLDRRIEPSLLNRDDRLSANPDKLRKRFLSYLVVLEPEFAQFVFHILHLRLLYIILYIMSSIMYIRTRKQITVQHYRKAETGAVVSERRIRSAHEKDRRCRIESGMTGRRKDRENGD